MCWLYHFFIFFICTYFLFVSHSQLVLSSFILISLLSALLSSTSFHLSFLPSRLSRQIISQLPSSLHLLPPLSPQNVQRFWWQQSGCSCSTTSRLFSPHLPLLLEQSAPRCGSHLQRGRERRGREMRRWSTSYNSVTDVKTEKNVSKNISARSSPQSHSHLFQSIMAALLNVVPLKTRQNINQKSKATTFIHELSTIQSRNYFGNLLFSLSKRSKNDLIPASMNIFSCFLLHLSDRKLNVSVLLEKTRLFRM